MNHHSGVRPSGRTPLFAFSGTEVAVGCRRRFHRLILSALDMRVCCMYLAPQTFCMATPASHIHPLVTALREAMQEHGLTQSQLAVELDVSERTVAYWMNEDVVPQKRFRPRIAAWLNQKEAA